MSSHPFLLARFGLLIAILVHGFSSSAIVQGGCITYRTVPVPPYPGGPAYPAGTILDQENEMITLPPGGPYRVWFELRISNWACSGHAMGTWQARYGREDTLPPGIVIPAQPCKSDAECAAHGMGPGDAAMCAFFPGDLCNPVFQQDPPQQPTALGFDIEACSLSPRLECGATQVSTPPVVDDGIEHYAMTIVLEVAPSFSGVGVINVRRLTDNTFFQDENGAYVGIREVIPARVIRDPVFCCRSNEVCEMTLAANCVGQGGTPVPACLGDCDGNLTEDACEFVDCNSNGVLDACDIINGTIYDFRPATDCDFNGIMDGCERTTCNGNFDHDNCEFAAGEIFDCNANRLPDECDIDSGTSVDADSDDVPDECEDLPMSRYVAFRPNDVISGATNHAARITLLSLPMFPQFNGEHRWLDPPTLFPDGSSPALEIYQFPASRVECDPVFTDWTAYPRYYAYGSAVVPGSQYEIRFGDQPCIESGDEACLSPPIVVVTGKWGDIVAPFGAASQPNFSDIEAMVAKFSQIPGAPIKPRSQLRNNETDPSVRVNFTDISLCVNAFQGFVYPYSGPAACAGQRE